MAALDHFLELRSGPAARGLACEGLAGCRRLSTALDEGIQSLAAPTSRTGLALVALGDYGGCEIGPRSAVDVMMLIDGEAGEAVRDVFYPLWNAGVKVGHSVRSVNDAMAAGRRDPDILTALLDARLIAGDRSLYERFAAARRKLVRERRGTLRADLEREHLEVVVAERWQLQEPDVERGRGGLRELRRIQWLEQADRIQSGRPIDSASSWPEPGSAAEMLWRVRNALHLVTDRATSEVSYDLVPGIAAVLGMDAISCMRGLLLAMREVDVMATARFSPQRAPARLVSRLFGGGRSGTNSGGVADYDRPRFFATLRALGDGQLDPLPSSGWLERLIPEWEPLRGLPNWSGPHRHPVDVHSVRTVVEVRTAIEDQEDIERTGTALVAAELQDRDEPLLAALLHDIGRGQNDGPARSGRAIAEVVAARLGMQPEAARRLATAVEQHQLLRTTAARRDIADERVIDRIAGLVGDFATLDVLYLLSVADARATGPDAWDSWRAAQLRSLYARLVERMAVLDGAAEASQVRRRNAVVGALDGRYAAAAVEDFLDGLPESYLLNTTPEMVGDHLSMLVEAAEGGTAIRIDHQGDLDRLTVLTADRPGVLSLIAGALAVHHVSILGGAAYSSDNRVAIDVLYVRDGLGRAIDEERWSRVQTAMRLALAGEFPMEERLAETIHAYRDTPRSLTPTRVQIDNSGSERYTIVEVTAADRIGLLYSIANALHGLGIDIHLAKVDTQGSEVVDAFYVLNEAGQQINALDEAERVRAGVVEAVAALDRITAPAAGR